MVQRSKRGRTDPGRQNQIVEICWSLIEEAKLDQLLLFLTPELIASRRVPDGPKEAVIRRAFARSSAPSRFDRATLVRALLTEAPRYGPLRSARTVAARSDETYDIVTVEALAAVLFGEADPLFRGWRCLLLLAVAVCDTDPEARAMLVEVHRQLLTDLGEVRQAYLPNEPTLTRSVAVGLLAEAFWSAVGVTRGSGRLKSRVRIEGFESADEVVAQVRMRALGGLAIDLAPSETRFGGTRIRDVAEPEFDEALEAVLLVVGQARFDDDFLAFIGPGAIVRRAGTQRPLTRAMITTAFGLPGRKNALDRRELVKVFYNGALDQGDQHDVVERLGMLRNASRQNAPYDYDLDGFEAELHTEVGRAFDTPFGRACGCAVAELAETGTDIVDRFLQRTAAGPLLDWRDRMLFAMTTDPLASARTTNTALELADDPLERLSQIANETFGALAEMIGDAGWRVRLPGLGFMPVSLTLARAWNHDMVNIAVEVTGGLNDVRTETIAADVLSLQGSLTLGRLRFTRRALVVDHTEFLRSLDPERLMLHVDAVMGEALHVREALRPTPGTDA